MNLIYHSLNTKGSYNFIQRLWTVFTRFGFSEARIERALSAIISSLAKYDGAPTFFIPAIVLDRHAALIANISRRGAEIGVHGYVHNDYRSLNETQQFEQTQHAVSIFHATQTPYQGFRNPYLGWTEESLGIFSTLDFSYESNEAVLHDVIDIEKLPSVLQSGYEKSRTLYRVLTPNAYTLRPHFEGTLLRIPTSVPDDEMLCDRLRISDTTVVGKVWSTVMQRTYDLGGIYALNLHPERGILYKHALDILLDYAHSLPRPVWLARLNDIAQWWKERNQFRFKLSQIAPNRWRVKTICSSHATLLARHLTVLDQDAPLSITGEQIINRLDSCIIEAAQCPCIGLSEQTAQQVQDFLHEQGYPTIRCTKKDAGKYALYLDIPEGLGTNREERLKQCSVLVQQIEALETPFLRFGCWPDGHQAALCITGDIDSITIQDFFLRIIEVFK